MVEVSLAHLTQRDDKPWVSGAPIETTWLSDRTSNCFSISDKKGVRHKRLLAWRHIFRHRCQEDTCIIKPCHSLLID